MRIWKRPYNYFIFERTRSSILSNLQLDNFIHVTRPDNGWETLILNKADYYSKVNAILSDTYNSVSLIIILTNTVNYETRRCYQENRQKNPFPTSYFSSSIQFNLLLGIKVIWSSCMGSQTFMGYTLQHFLVSILDSLTRNQFSVKNSLLHKAHCNKLSDSKNPSTLPSLL